MSNPEWAGVPVEHAGVGIDVSQPDYRIAPKPITPEEQAVIDAAIAWSDANYWDVALSITTEENLVNAINLLKSK